jgi:hypothetical protein
MSGATQLLPTPNVIAPQAAESTDLSIIIVSWNTRSLLDNCLASVFANLEITVDLACEVWVVDNASEDGSAALVREKYPRVRLIENGENTGFARANNQALAVCAGRWVCLLNSDTIVHPGAFSTLLQAAEIDERIGMVGPLLLNGDGTIQQSWSRFVGPVHEFRGRHDRRDAPFALQSATLPPPPGTVAPFATGWLGGACLLARREAIAQVGLLDEGYFMYCEETDWCRRFSRAGWKVVCVPDAHVIHLGGQSSRQVSQATRERLAASKVRYFQQHGRPWDVWQARALGALYLLRGRRRRRSVA